MNGRLVPLCQNDNCAKPLHSLNEREYLFIRRGPSAVSEQAVFCNDCADLICREYKHEDTPLPEDELSDEPLKGGHCTEEACESCQ